MLLHIFLEATSTNPFWLFAVATLDIFFSARDRFDAGQSIQWADLAAEQGFADQAHLSRSVKHNTGFSPSEFSMRFVEDESFWLYRLWV